MKSIGPSNMQVRTLQVVLRDLGFTEISVCHGYVITAVYGMYAYGFIFNHEDNSSWWKVIMRHTAQERRFAPFRVECQPDIFLMKEDVAKTLPSE